MRENDEINLNLVTQFQFNIMCHFDDKNCIGSRKFYVTQNCVNENTRLNYAARNYLTSGFEVVNLQMKQLTDNLL